jgi:hypothetical protein
MLFMDSTLCCSCLDQQLAGLDGQWHVLSHAVLSWGNQVLWL